jgi:hypothetical protein
MDSDFRSTLAETVAAGWFQKYFWIQAWYTNWYQKGVGETQI